MRILVVLAVALSSATSAAAQPPPAAREGLSFGVGLTFGSLVADCDDCSDAFEAAGVQMHAGWMVRPYLALVGELWVMAHSDGFTSVYHSLATASARAWATRRLWLQGGLGLATTGYRSEGILTDDEERTVNRPGFMAGAGFEAIQRRSFALSLELRYGTGFDGHSLGVGATAEWY